MCECEGKRCRSIKLPIQNWYMGDSAIHKHQVSSLLLEKLCRAALSRLAQLFCFHDIAKSFSFSTVETEARNCTCHMFADFCITSAFCIIPAVTED